MLLAFRASLPDLKGKDLPSRLLVAKWGVNESVKGAFTVGTKTQRFLAPLQKMLGFDTVALDFEHSTVPGSPEYEKSKEPRIVAAHGVPRVVPGEGIFIEELRWTPEGEASVKGGHHPDLSPTIKTDDSGEVVFLHSTALCRQGAVADLQVFAAGLTPAQLLTFSATLQSTPMNHKELLCLILGLDHNSATDAQITEAAKGFATKLTAAIGAGSQLTTLNTTVEGLKTSIGQLQGKLDKSERDQLVAAALRDGKLIPHGAEFDAMNNAQFGAVLASLQAGVVPVEKRTPELVKTFAAPGVGTNDGVAAEVHRQLGVSAEIVAKHNK